MALKGFQVTVEGTSELLCSNVASSDPLGEGSKQKAFFHSKRKKNDEDHRALRTLDWIFSGYWKKHGEVSIDENTTKLIFDSSIEHEILMRHLQVADACVATLGIDVVSYVLTKKPLGIVIDSESEGISGGLIENPDTLNTTQNILLKDDVTPANFFSLVVVSSDTWGV